MWDRELKYLELESIERIYENSWYSISDNLCIKSMGNFISAHEEYPDDDIYKKTITNLLYEFDRSSGGLFPYKGAFVLSYNRDLYEAVQENKSEIECTLMTTTNF